MMYMIFVTSIVLALAGCGNNSNAVVETDSFIEDTIVSYESNNSLYNNREIEAIEIDFASTISLNNKAAYVTSQCYTKTVDENNNVHNPCFSCHISSTEPNYVDDWEVQKEYDFGEYTRTNRYTNLFKDRSPIVDVISDEEILSYVKEDNYIQKGKILLAEKLKNLPSSWDVNQDGVWNGYTPDCYFNFDDEGFDISPQANFTGWRAFGYRPFLGTFWPTNGSTDDVLIRLPKVFMQDENEIFSLDVYKLNLSIVESLIKQSDVAINEVDENIYGVDFNQNGVLDKANKIVFKWVQPVYDPATGKIKDFSMSYVGQAKKLLIANEYLIAPGLYPKETEFLHSVRYIDEDGTGVKMAKRMKELRYAKKTTWLSYAELSNSTLTDIKEKDSFPDRLRTIIGSSETGLLNNVGWVFQGFIEDAYGELRVQNFEETQFCIGCHSGIGAIADSTFVFQRKLEKGHFQDGWYHWSQDANGLKGISEPKTFDGRDEYALYLQSNGAGDEFRTNTELQAKFFDENLSVKVEELAKMHNDISYLLNPSQERAKELNKAYKVIVEEQSYIYGRDAHVTPLTNVHEELELETSTEIMEPIKYH